MAKAKFPHPITLLVACILLAAAATWLVPAGEYERQVDDATGREVVVAGTFDQVESNPVGVFAAMVAIPRGIAEAADVIALVLLIGGAFTVVDETGALRRGVASLVRGIGHNELLVIPVIALPFAAGGALENMQEEIIALVPVLLILTRRIGFTPIVAVAMSAGAAFIGSAFSPINPFQVGIAQKLAELPLLSGAMLRTIVLLVALTLWIGSTMRYAARTRVEPTDTVDSPDEMMVGRDATILGLVLITFVVLTFGLARLGWGFDEMSALFFVMGAIVGIIGRLGLTGTAEAYVRGFRDMAYAAILIGFARAIYVVLEQGRIVDTIVHAMFTPIADLPVSLSALGMVAAHTAVHVPVPSVSGHAVLTMPVLVPLSDLIGLSRQVTVLAYQIGAGLTDMFTPTNGALMAILAAAGVRYNEWIRFLLPRYLMLLAIGIAAIVIGIATGWQ